MALLSGKRETPVSLPPFGHLLRQIQPPHGAQHSTADTRKHLHAWPKAGPPAHSIDQLRDYLNGCEPEPWIFVTAAGFYRCPFCDDKDRSNLVAFVKHIKTRHSHSMRSPEVKTSRNNGSSMSTKNLRKIMPNCGVGLQRYIRSSNSSA